MFPVLILMLFINIVYKKNILDLQQKKKSIKTAFQLLFQLIYE